MTLAESQQVLDTISESIEASRRFAREAGVGHDNVLQEGWSTKFFSDNLAFGYPIDRCVEGDAREAWRIVRCAQSYQLMMTLNKSFVRGAMTIGPVCLTDEIIFGSALIECYRLESKTSIVPRIVLAEPLRDFLLHSYESKGERPMESRNAVCRDIDGWWFVNYLEAAVRSDSVEWSMIDQHKTNILESLAHTTRHDVLPKYGWACRYHNLFCHWHREDPGYTNRYRIDRYDEESSMLRLGEKQGATLGNVI